MPRAFTEEEWEEKRREFLEWLKENPKARGTDVREAGYGGVINRFYNGVLNKAKEDVFGVEIPRGGRYSIEERIDFVEKYIFSSYASQLRPDASTLLEWRNDDILKEIARRRNISVESLKGILEYRSKGLPFDIIIHVFELLKSGKTHEEAAEKAGININRIPIWKKDKRITNGIKELLDDFPELFIKQRPRGYWTEERVNEAYDQLKRKIAEKGGKERTPSFWEFEKECGGARYAIRSGAIPRVASYTQYVISRGDKPLINFRTLEVKLSELEKYLKGSMVSELSSYPLIYDWLKNSNILKSLLERFEVNNMNILSKRDFVNLGIRKKRINIFLSRLLSNNLFFKVGRDYTPNEELAIELNQLYEEINELKTIAPRTAKKLRRVARRGVKARVYNKDMIAKMRKATRRIYERSRGVITKVPEELTTSTITVGREEGVLELLNLLHRTEDVENAFGYEKVMTNLEDEFVEAYADSAPFFSQYNLAKQLLESKLGD